jgi:hypothetical protein
MSNQLAELQNAFAALVTKGELQAHYGHAPSPTVEGLSADESVRAALRGLSPREVIRYARGLRNKRWHDVSATVPLATCVVSRLRARYDEWLAKHPPVAEDTVLSPGAVEALRALDELARDVRDDPGEAPWAADLMGFEVLAACSRTDGLTRTLRTRYAVHAIVSDLRGGLIPLDPPIAPHIYTFGADGVRTSRIEGPNSR